MLPINEKESFRKLCHSSFSSITYEYANLHIFEDNYCAKGLMFDLKNFWLNEGLKQPEREHQRSGFKNQSSSTCLT